MEENPVQLPVSPQETQLEPPKSPITKAPKWILIGGLLVLLFGGAVFGAYKLGQSQIQPKPTPLAQVVTPTPDSTANWKTFTSSNYHYSFKYPENWFSTDCNNKNLLLLHSQGIPSCIDVAGAELVFEINNKDNPSLIGDLLTGNELLLQNTSQGNDIKKYYFKSKNQNDQPGAFAIYKIPLNGGYELDVVVFNKSNENITDQILSTLKFLK